MKRSESDDKKNTLFFVSIQLHNACVPRLEWADKPHIVRAPPALVKHAVLRALRSVAAARTGLATERGRLRGHASQPSINAVLTHGCGFAGAGTEVHHVGAPADDGDGEGGW